MENTKTFIGFSSLLLTIVVFLQSCAASTAKIAESDQAKSGSVGMLVAIIILVAGIEALNSRNSKGKTIFSAILYTIAGILALTARSVYGYLVLWGIVSLVFAFVFFYSYHTYRKIEAIDNQNGQ